MDNVISFSRGRAPLLISMPHPGTHLTPAVEAGMVAAGWDLTDTDWHIPRLYDFAAELGASTLAAQYSWPLVNLCLALLYLPMLVITWRAPEAEHRFPVPKTLREAEVRELAVVGRVHDPRTVG